MRAFIKIDRWLEFVFSHMEYGFMTDENPLTKKDMYVRPVDMKKPMSLFLIVTMDRELHLVTPMGESPFMETQEEHFKDLIDKGYVEYEKGEFD